MKIVQIEQGTPEWLQWRLNRITATDCAVIMGISPFKDVHMLWYEKNELVAHKSITEPMKRGNALEPIARELFISKVGIEMNPICIEHDEIFWHASSLDGIDETKKILLEIKCPNLEKHFSRKIDDHYLAQMQHQLYTSGADICYFCSYHPDDEDKIWVQEIYPNREFQEEMIEKEMEFYEKEMCLLKRPWILKLKG